MGSLTSPELILVPLWVTKYPRYKDIGLTKYPRYKDIGLEGGSNLVNQQYFENCAIFGSKNQSECGTSGLE